MLHYQTIKVDNTYERPSKIAEIPSKIAFDHKIQAMLIYLLSSYRKAFYALGILCKSGDK